MADKVLFDAELLLRSNGEQFVAEVRNVFRRLDEEARRLISQGSQAGISGIPAQYSSALGQVAAFIQRKPLLTERQQELATGSLRGAERNYGQLQSLATASGLNLPGVTALSSSYQEGSRLIDQALKRQSNAALQAAADAEKLAVAERQAARANETASRRLAEGAAPPGQTRFTGAQQEALLRGFGIPQERIATAQESQALAIRTSTARMQAGDTEFLRARAQAAIAERQRSIAIARATHDEAIAQGQTGGSVFQRLQYAIHARSGLTDTRLPEDFQTFGQFFTSKALTTGGFALSGAVLYGAVSGFREITREASALQRELAVVKSTFDSLGDTQGFQRFAQQVVSISVETGIAADEVARVARQLAGVFRVQNTGLPDFNRALSETEQALKLSQVTGLPFQEITDSLTAITVTFGDSFTKIGDLAIGLERKFGVLAPQLIQFTADVAPVAKELGFTVDQITALGAIAQQRSGVSGGALAENFNRALPAIQQTQIALAQLLGQNSATSQYTNPILDALAQSKGAEALKQLTLAYQKMDAAQRTALGELLGGQRNAKAFFAVLQGGQDTIDALNGKTGDFSGALEKRFSDFQSTVEFAFEKARRALEQFGLALFNSGLADGLKLVADSAALVARFGGVLLEIFSKFNDVLGGMPIKLLAVYTTLRLISALGGGIGGFRNIIANVGRGGAAGAAAESAPAASGFASPFNAAAFAAPAETAATSAASAGFRASLSNALRGVAPAIGALAVAQVLQTASEAGAAIKQQQQDLISNIQGQLSKGVSQDEIVRRMREAGAFDNATGSLAGDVVLKVLTLGQADTKSPGDVGIDKLQRDWAGRQGEELAAILKGADAAQRKRIAQFLIKQPGFAETLQPLLQSSGTDPDLANRLAQSGKLEQAVDTFLHNPTNNYLNDAFARLIHLVGTGGLTPELAQALLAIGALYDGNIKKGTQDATSQAASQYQPVLEEVKARYDIGNANLEELVHAEKVNILLLTDALAHVGADQRVQAAKQLASAQQELDSTLTTAATKAADLLVKIGTIKGGNANDLTFLAKTQALNALIQGGASPGAQLDAALNVLDAQSKQLDQKINSPVFINGIARAPTSAEKLARASQGLEVSPALREAIIRASLLINKGGDVAGIAKVSGISTDKIIDSVVQILRDGDHTIQQTLLNAIDSKEENLRRELVNLDAGDSATIQQVHSALAALEAARTALENLPSGATDPGTKLTQDTTDLQNQAALDASQEADAMIQAVAAKERALAHGDPILTAQAAVRAAQAALDRARASGAKPSEITNLEAALIDAQNQLEDANNAVILAFINLAAATTHDPVKKARYELDAANKAVEDAKGTAAEYDALARQMAAQESVADALTAVFVAQHNLLAAIDTAAGDTIGAAKEQLAIAQQNLDRLIARDVASHDDPNNDPDVINAKAAVATAQANVRDTALRKQESDIDIALQLEKITTAQAIAQFQALLQIPNLTADETNEILLKIKQLQGELSRDLQFDIPSEINLGGLFYQARRINQGQGFTPGGPAVANDNRTISLFAGATIVADQGQLDDAVNTIVDTINAPPRSGPRVGAY